MDCPVANPTLQLLLDAIQRQEHDVAEHSRRVQSIALSLGRRMALDEESLTLLSAGALLHDLGKFLVPVELLRLPRPLTRRELAIMREHPDRSAALCAAMPWLSTVRPIVRAHHERLDGSGYPDGLRGTAIPLLAQIVQLADISDALLSHRSYKPPMRLDHVSDILRAEAASGWHDRSLTGLCIAVLEEPQHQIAYTSPPPDGGRPLWHLDPSLPLFSSCSR